MRFWRLRSKLHRNEMPANCTGAQPCTNLSPADSSESFSPTACINERCRVGCDRCRYDTALGPNGFVNIRLASPVTAAASAEHRKEAYKVGLGDAASSAANAILPPCRSRRPPQPTIDYDACRRLITQTFMLGRKLTIIAGAATVLYAAIAAGDGESDTRASFDFDGFGTFGLIHSDYEQADFVTQVTFTHAA